MNHNNKSPFERKQNRKNTHTKSRNDEKYAIGSKKRMINICTFFFRASDWTCVIFPEFSSPAFPINWLILRECFSRKSDGSSANDRLFSAGHESRFKMHFPYDRLWQLHSAAIRGLCANILIDKAGESDRL